MVVNIGSNPTTLSSDSFVKPDNVDDSDATFFYFGWESVNGSWLIRKQVRLTSLSTEAKIGVNGTYADLTAAWAAKEALIYT